MRSLRLWMPMVIQSTYLLERSRPHRSPSRSRQRLYSSQATPSLTANSPIPAIGVRHMSGWSQLSDATRVMLLDKKGDELAVAALQYRMPLTTLQRRLREYKTQNA